ncbi:MAG: hypothetical protein ACFFCX_18180, partial [Candidatus Sifarchaeia archaeon]
CENQTSVQGVALDNGDGTYTIRTNTSQLPILGRYTFKVNFTWAFVQPFYQNITNRVFRVLVIAVSTVLQFSLPQGVTFYPGDLVVGNISYTVLETGLGIDGIVATNWNETYPTDAYISVLSVGLWSISIDTTGLNAQLYSFVINATKFYHVNQTITVDILLSALPLEVELNTNPTSPIWGVALQLDANVTDARTGSAILNANVTLTILGQSYNMTEIGSGIYRFILQTGYYSAGEIVVSIRVELVNHETRQRDFQIRIGKVDSALTAFVDPVITINGGHVTITANYSLLSNGTEISAGTVTYSWIGGSGQFIWSSGDRLYIADIAIDNIAVGSHQILVQAKSGNYKTVSLPLNIEVREINTEIKAEQDETVLSVVWGAFLNVTVFLNNTDIGEAVDAATLSYGVGLIIGDLVELGNGYYYAYINTTGLDVREYQLTISSVKNGFAPSSLQYTLEVENIPTEIVPISNAYQSVYYGMFATYTFYLNDTFNNQGVENASSHFVLEAINGSLISLGGGYYELQVNSSWLLAGSFPHDISISFQKDKYEYAFTTAKIVVIPIPTEIVGSASVSIPVGDDFRQLFIFNDTLNGLPIDNAGTATAIWEFGTVELSNLGDGSYSFGFSEAEISRLEIGEYTVRIVMSLTNYRTSELTIELAIREIETSVVYSIHPTPIYAGTVFYVDVTYLDMDHGIAIPNARNITLGEGLSLIPDQSVNFGNGTYRFAFIAPGVGVYDFGITFSRTDYAATTASFTVYPGLSQEQLALLSTFQYGAIIFMLLTLFGAVYVRILSVPKLLRKLRSMVSQLDKGRIPTPAVVNSRRLMLLASINEDLEPLGIQKSEDDVAKSTL